MNAKKGILKLLRGEEIEAISLGDLGDSWSDGTQPIQFYEGEKIKEGLKKLDFEFDSGFGGQEGYCVYVWSKSWIIVKGYYDGSEWYERIPRNPDKNIRPESIGGG